MKMTTSSWLAVLLPICLVAFAPAAYGQCPAGANRDTTVFSCSQLDFDLQRALAGGAAVRFEWRAKAPVAGVDGESLDLQTGRYITDALTNTTAALQDVVYEVVPVGAGECRGDAFTVTVHVRPRVENTGCIACNNVVNLTFSQECSAVLTLEEAAEGESGSACENRDLLLQALYVAVFDGDYPDGDPAKADGNIAKPGAFTFEVRLDPAFAGCFEWVPCWGTVNVEDKPPPVVTCPPAVIGLVKTETTPGKAEAVVDGVPYTYRPAAGADAGCPAGATCDDNCPSPVKGFNYLVCTDVDSVFQVSRSWQDETYPYFTGRAAAADCSGAVLTDVRDVLLQTECGEQFLHGRQVEARIERTFTFRDPVGNTGSCTQLIYFFRPDIVLPYCLVTLDLCDYPGIKVGNAPGLLDPVATATAPYYINGLCRRIPLTGHACRFTATYSDEALPGPENCGVKVIRTWTFLDWCWTPDYTCENFRAPVGCEDALSGWTNKKRTYEQHLIVADTDKPKVSCPDLGEFSTGPFNCTAVVAPPAPIVRDECSSWTWEFELYGDKYDPKTGITRPNQFIAASVNRVAPGIAPGAYDLHYIVRDACGNESRTICPILVVDNISPVAVCNDALQVSIGGANTSADGVARVAAADVDEGSNDNCGLASLTTRRQIGQECLDTYTELVVGAKSFAHLVPVQQEAAPAADRKEYPKGMVFYYTADPSQSGNAKLVIILESDGFFYSAWADAVFFTCCDISTGAQDKVRIELRAVDTNGNRNICWLRVLVQDKLPPRCEVPNARILCTDLDFDPRDPAQVARRFGSADQVVTVNDNCGATLSENMRWRPGNCGKGVIERVFTVKDNGGLMSTCTQTITLQEVNAYTIRFPRDLGSAQCGTQLSDSLVQVDQGCDILAIDRDTARYDATGNECFKLFITYKVINWCEYDGESLNPTIIPRDLDQDNDLGEYTWLEAGLDSAFAKKYLPGETEFFLVKLFAADKQGVKKALPERVLVRADCPAEDRHVGYRIWEHKGNGLFAELCRKDAAKICAGQLYNTQCWTPGFYRYTQILKVYDNVPPDITVISNDFDFCAYGDPATSCDARVDVMLTVTDNCTLNAAEVQSVKLLLDRDPNKAVGPESGFFTLMEAEDVCVITAWLPEGNYAFVVRAADGCGNFKSRTVNFTVRDCKAPGPVCINGVGIELMAVDTDGDGVVDGGLNTVWVSDLIASEVTDCNGPVTYSLNRFGETPNRAKTSLTVSCDDPLFETIPIEVHAWDALGNHGFCETFVIVQDYAGLCGPIGNGAIAGLVLTEQDDPVDNVTMSLNGKRADQIMTGDDGAYVFRPLEEGYDYTVTPFRDGDYLNGVSTFDLVLISKHILNVKPLNSPYKLIAADANRSGSVTTLDLITLRKLILNVETVLRNNTSWRFIPTRFAFPAPKNPFGGPFPEVLNVNNLTGKLANADFVAIKVGDVNASVQASSFSAPVVRSRAGTLTLSAPDLILPAGETVAVPVYCAQADLIEGLQFTLALDPAAVDLVSVEEGLMKTGDWAAFPDKGILTASWVNLGSDFRLPTSDFPLFTLVLRSHQKINLHHLLQLTARPTAAEAYDRQEQPWDVALTFQPLDEEFALLPNYPNPFREHTAIPFILPNASAVTLTVHDAAGRQLHSFAGKYDRGYHEIQLDRRDLPAGVLYYSLRTAEHRASRSMVAAGGW